MEDELLKTRGAGAFLNYSSAGIRELVRLGILKPVRLSPQGQFRFRRSDLERLIDDCGHDGHDRNQTDL